MPEGPSIVILREQAEGFAGRTIKRASGNAKAVDFDGLVEQKVLALRSWGKHFLIQLPDRALRIHLLMFGSYRINERKPDAEPRLSLGFDDGEEFNFYTCSVKTLPPDLDAQYDWRSDVMSDQWDARLALKKLRAQPEMLVCDATLDQEIFSGAGNIFKNEVLFRIRVHPLSRIGALSAAKQRELVEQMRAYAFDFLRWKKAFVLKQHWLAHTKRICPRCDIPFHKAHLGKTKRRSFFCVNCQKQYPPALTPVRSDSRPRSQRTPPAS
ncbi:endonuclease [Duganella sp. sic0402]|uniref:DNA-formamidopyrimidine glycosylase family protein n=1 Tax=Duganella sp. sic0402 TaxID=2854786 RepID=UPI001C44BFC3|nr:DNA-formamidopyrimidine glycosylase family protein [Duganella sp. sic0402]MBV7538304.1 endonuclease [Duganella sp. sic0402]